MRQIAKFLTVSQQQFTSDGGGDITAVRLPERATKGSAGYDFFLPCNIEIEPKQSIVVATGLRVKMKSDYVLLILPKSGLGFKYGLTLANTVGVIDSDYINADNQGHILVKLINCGEQKIELAQGKAFVQGLFVPFGITECDSAQEKRVGGFGSTEKL